MFTERLRLRDPSRSQPWNARQCPATCLAASREAAAQASGIQVGCLVNLLRDQLAGLYD